MKVTTEAHTFYSMIALLKVTDRYSDYLLQSGEVSYGLKPTIKILQNRIKDLSKGIDEFLAKKHPNDAQTWKKEWNDKDFEVYGSILFILNDMNEQQRATAEQFMQELQKGTIKAVSI